ncbi:MAG: hypothetical protein HY432_02495 [Candidatus Liptonbacteria bacterium]|nr:hypothetical protein [Candidatus Liptonbacteria bacterium]
MAKALTSTIKEVIVYQIYQFLMIERSAIIKINRGAQILSCKMVGGILTLFALADTRKMEMKRHFVALRVGDTLRLTKEKLSQLRFVGTVVNADTKSSYTLGGGSPHWHVFEKIGVKHRRKGKSPSKR